MDNQLYKEIILDHFRSPRNNRPLKKVDRQTTLRNEICGDEVRVSLALKDNHISDVQISSNGCAISVAAGSVLSDLVKGKSVAAAQAISHQTLLQELGITPGPERLKCAVLALDALHRLTQPDKKAA